MLRFLLLLAFVAVVQPQCLTANDTQIRAPSSDLTGITDFGLDLFKELYDHTTPKNFFFSPYSVWNALVLAYFGSRGTTETQLAKVLNVPDKVSTFNKWRKLEFIYEMRSLKSSDYTFNLANRAYFDNSVQLRPCMESILFTEIQKLDFADTVGSAEVINNWVSNVTKNLIKNIVTSDDLDGTIFALSNAAYFKGTWTSQFNESVTDKKKFYMTPQHHTFIDMMYQEGRFRHGTSEDLGANILELPYLGNSMSMYILLPHTEHGFNTMVENLNSSNLRDAMKYMRPTQVQVQLPKFKLEQTIKDELMNGLQNMGIRDLFDARHADLAGFAPMRGVAIGKSIHKAFVEVNEEGTEAAAATVFQGIRMAPPAPIEFTCDHPFVFFIYDNLTKNIIFIGAYKNPTDLAA